MFYYFKHINLLKILKTPLEVMIYSISQMRKQGTKSLTGFTQLLGTKLGLEPRSLTQQPPLSRGSARTGWRQGTSHGTLVAAALGAEDTH